VRNLKNKKNDFLKIFITGGGSGIGKEVAFALFSMGYEVFVGVKYESEIALFQKIIIQNPSKIHVLCCDILKENDRKKISELGIDILVCNAAIGNSGSVAEVSIKKIREVFDTNVFAHLECIQLVISDMMERMQKGRIVIVSSLVRTNSPSLFSSILCY
jgi:short-subunit dehydrogenase